MRYAKSKETKERLIKTMSHLLRTQGFHATGITQVINDSGIPKGSLYYHFPKGKVELASGSIEQSAEKLYQLLSQMMNAAQSPIDAVRTFCDFYINEMDKGNFTRGCPIATITLEAAATNDPIQLSCKDAFQKLGSIFEHHLLENGLYPQKSKEMAIVALASIEGALILCKAQRSTEAMTVVRDNLIKQLTPQLNKNEDTNGVNTNNRQRFK